MRKFIAAFVAVLALGATAAYAQSTTSPDESASAPANASLSFPVPELGNCNSKEECKAYCDASGHGNACLDYAEKNGLMSAADIARARAAIAEHAGPGGCDGLDACRAYCNDPANAQECTQFAQAHGLIAPGGPSNQSADTAKIVQVIQTQGGPGGCTSLGQCKQYCDDAAHHDECQKFAVDNGLTPPRQDQSRGGPSGQDQGPTINEDKAQQILAQKPGPGGCASKDACRAYCADSSHMEECLTFAKDNGLMSAADAVRAQQFASQTGPGGCRGQTCQAYCDDQSHAQECIAFAEKNGLMSAGEVQKARTLISKPGPGGCTGDACKTYCADQSHADECTQFAVQNGFITQEEADRMKSQRMQSGPGGCTGQDCQTYCQDPAYEDECAQFFAKDHGQTPVQRTDPEGQEPISGPRGGLGDAFGPNMHEGGGPAPSQMQGPGGCSSPDACATYCKGHEDECANFQPPPQQNQNPGTVQSPQGGQTGDMMRGQFGGPQGQPKDRGGRYGPPGPQDARFNGGSFGPSGSHQGYPGTFQGEPGDSQFPPPDMERGQFQGPPPAGADAPPPTIGGPSSFIGSNSFVAAVYSIFAQLFMH